MEFFNLHTHRFSNNENVLELVNQYPHEFDVVIPNYSIGIHPWHINENRIESDLEIIESKLKDEKCLALGECGLDSRIEFPITMQLAVFEKQLALAEKYKKPVVIHCVGCFEQVIAIKKKLNISVPMIIHGFSKNKEIAKQLIRNGFYTSFGKNLLRNPDLETVFASIPIERFFLETDTIEEDISSVYEIAAKYRNIELATMKAIINANFDTVFK